MRLNNKGFSLIEILAVVVILGIVSTIGIVSVTRLIDNSRKHYYESQQNNLVLAARAYASDHKEVLPRNVGEIKKIELNTLYENNYIKDKIVDKNKGRCYSKNKYDDSGKLVERGSYVNVVKTSTSEYSYKGYLYCESCGLDGNCEEEKASNDNPVVEIKFPPNSGNNLFDESTTIDLTFIAKGNNAKVSSYSYKIYVNNSLKFNSGTKINGKRDKVEIHEPVYKYLPGNVKVVATITNSDGVIKSYSKSKDYSDSQFPACGQVKYDMNNIVPSYDSNKTSEYKCGTKEYPWVYIGTDNGTRHAWVVCDDSKGIGCSQPEFSKFLESDGEVENITIKDSNNKDQSCQVMKCIDRSTPKITVNIKNGNTIKHTYTVQVQKIQKDYKPEDKYNVWLNKSTYPNGVTVEVIINDGQDKKDDSSLIKKISWYQSPKEMRENQVDHKTKVSEKIVDKSDMADRGECKGLDKLVNKECKEYKYSKTITEDGVRREEIKVEDYAGNKVTYSLILKIDRTAPTIPTTNLKKWKNNNTRPTSSSGLSNYSNNTWYNGKVFTYPSDSVDKPNISGVKEYHYTTTGATSNESKTTSYRNVEAEGISYIKWKSCDVAENCSDYNTQSTIKLDRTKPTCSISKTDTHNTTGVTLTTTCNDSYSGVASCEQKHKNVQSSKTYTVEDNVGLTNTCSKDVYSKQERHKSRTSSQVAYCASSSCELGGGVCGCHKIYVNNMKCTRECSGNCASYGAIKDANICTWSESVSYKTVWSDWGDWSKWSDTNSTSCTEGLYDGNSKYRECRTRYY